MSGSGRVGEARVTIGDSPPPVSVGPLTHSDFIRYAGAFGEFNPVHEDIEVARRAGYPDIFAQGMLMGALAANQVRDWLGQERIRSFTARFRAPAFRDDLLRIECRAAALDESRDRMRLESTITNQAGETLLTAQTEVEV